MADTATVDMRDRNARDFAPDLVGVGSRVSWGAIFGGTVIALACYVALTFLFAAIGISLSDAGVRANAIGVGAIVVAICTIVISLFVGGWVSSQLTVGENRQEAAIYGILTWAAVIFVSMLLVGMGVRAGYFAFVGGSMVAQNNARVPAWEDAARQAGVPEAQIADAKAKIDPSRVRAEVNDPANQQKALDAAVTASWAALVGMMLSMAAAVGGALVGRGMVFRLFPVVRVREAGGARLVVPTA